MTVSAIVKNIGLSPSAGCYAIVEPPSTCVSSITPPPSEYVPPLSPNGTYTVTWTWSPTPSGAPCLPSQGPGLFGCVLNIKVDVPNLVTESNENDNVGTCSVCCKVSRADLMITSSSSNGTCTCVQDPLMSTCTITVNTVVKNIGTADSYQCDATIVDANGNSHLLFGGIPGLFPNQSQTVSWSWTFGCDKLCPCVTLNPGTLTMTINSNFTGGESNYFNNSAVMVVCCH